MLAVILVSFVCVFFGGVPSSSSSSFFFRFFFTDVELSASGAMNDIIIQCCT